MYSLNGSVKIRGLNGNGKKYNKKKTRKEIMQVVSDRGRMQSGTRPSADPQTQ